MKLTSIMGIGDWGLGIGDWGLGPIPNPQSPFFDKYNVKSVKIISQYYICFKYISMRIRFK